METSVPNLILYIDFYPILQMYIALGEGQIILVDLILFGRESLCYLDHYKIHQNSDFI